MSIANDPNEIIADHSDEVTILFADIVGLRLAPASRRFAK
ncbi:class 3 adenylate cyclase [Bradyrhizobium sp. OAE829]